MIGQHDCARRSSVVEHPALTREDVGSSPAGEPVEIRCSSVVEHPARDREDAGSSPVNGSPAAILARWAAARNGPGPAVCDALPADSPWINGALPHEVDGHLPWGLPCRN